MWNTAGIASALYSASSTSISAYQNTPSPRRLTMRKKLRTVKLRLLRLQNAQSSASQRLICCSEEFRLDILCSLFTRGGEQDRFHLAHDVFPSQSFHRLPCSEAQPLHAIHIRD